MNHIYIEDSTLEIWQLVRWKKLAFFIFTVLSLASYNRSCYLAHYQQRNVTRFLFERVSSPKLWCTNWEVFFGKFKEVFCSAQSFIATNSSQLSISFQFIYFCQHKTNWNCTEITILLFTGSQALGLIHWMPKHRTSWFLCFGSTRKKYFLQDINYMCVPMGCELFIY